MKTLQTDLICFSHLRWGFVYQRPQHLLSRFARQHRVFFFEEPVFSGGEPRLESRAEQDGVYVVAPHMAGGLPPREVEQIEARLLGQLLRMARSENHFFW